MPGHRQSPKRKQATRVSAEQELRERAKELAALHAAARILAQTDAAADTVLRQLADVLPKAFQFPEIASARVAVGGTNAETVGFVDSPWVLVAPFDNGDGVKGCVKVAYSAEPSSAGGGAFLAEEGALLNTIARMVCGAFEYRAADADLRASEDQLRRVTEAIDEVYWLYDWESGEHICLNGAFEKVWGSKVESGREIAGVFLDSILAEDRLAVEEFLEQQRQHQPCEVRYRIRRPDGTVRLIHDRAFPIRDALGRPYRTAGVAKDVTAAEEAELQARSGAAKLAFLTPRQRDVLQLLAEGKSVKEAAFLLGRSPKTIETHKAELMERLGLPDVSALVRFAMRLGLVR